MSTPSRTTPSCNIARASDASTLSLAVQILANGGLVAIPTETVYGLGAANIGTGTANHESVRMVRLFSQ